MKRFGEAFENAGMDADFDLFWADEELERLLEQKPVADWVSPYQMGGC